MKVINLLNFVRACEPRDYQTNLIIEFNKSCGMYQSEEEKAQLNDRQWRYDRVCETLYSVTRRQYELAKSEDVPSTFLLQYDALCDERYYELFSNADEKCEIGIWYEIVKPLTDACGMEYKSREGWSWDWHIEPGFSMSYTPAEREKLIDEAMDKFRRVFGYYPKVIGSWLIDTHTVNYLADKYEIDAICICRDEVNTDAYTLVGGYFNGAYFPSRKNMFTPAVSEELTLDVPVFRMLGPDPIHNYDNEKYLSEKRDFYVYTMEPAGAAGKYEWLVDWFYRTYYVNEDLGFSYLQIGQENSFCMEDVIGGIKMNIDLAKRVPGVEFMTLGAAGRAFKAKYGKKTPATAVCALDNWDSEDVQSIYYDSVNYTANLFRHNGKVFLRSLYLFDELVEDYYMTEKCKTFDGIYENQPVIDTIDRGEEDKTPRDWYIDRNGEEISVEKPEEGVLKASWADKSVVFYEDKIEIYGADVEFAIGAARAEVEILDNKLVYTYRGRKYSANVDCGKLTGTRDKLKIASDGGKAVLSFHIL